MLTKRADHLTPPFRLCWCCDRGDPYDNNPRALADAILLQCQVFGMQFVFLRPLTTIATVVLEKLQYYGGGDGPQDYRSPQFYIVIVQNISIFTAAGSGIGCPLNPTHQNLLYALSHISASPKKR